MNLQTPKPVKHIKLINGQYLLRINKVATTAMTRATENVTKRLVLQEEIPEGSEYYMFTRHPLDRFCSAAFGNYRVRKATIGNLVQAVLDTYPGELEKHLRPQYLFEPKGCKVVFQGRFEHMKRDWYNMCKRLDFISSSIRHLNQSVNPGWEEALGDKHIENLYKYYKEDFELYGYSYPENT